MTIISYNIPGGRVTGDQKPAPFCDIPLYNHIPTLILPAVAIGIHIDRGNSSSGRDLVVLHNKAIDSARFVK